MIVCICEAVSENEVRSVIALGARDVQSVGDRCRAGTCCKMCRPDIREMIAEVAPCNAREAMLAKPVISK